MLSKRTVAVMFLACLGACSVPGQQHAQVINSDNVPFALLDPGASPVVPTTAPGPASEQVVLCFVRDGRLVQLEVPLTPPVQTRDVIDLLASPPEEAPAPVRTVLADPRVIRNVAVTAGVARVDLAASIAELGGDDQLLGVAQIVCTLTARPGIGQVSFAVEGAPVEVPRGDGSLVSQPVSRDDYSSLL